MLNGNTQAEQNRTAFLSEHVCVCVRTYKCMYFPAVQKDEMPLGLK